MWINKCAELLLTQFAYENPICWYAELRTQLGYIIKYTKFQTQRIKFADSKHLPTTEAAYSRKIADDEKLACRLGWINTKAKILASCHSNHGCHARSAVSCFMAGSWNMHGLGFGHSAQAHFAICRTESSNTVPGVLGIAIPFHHTTP